MEKVDPVVKRETGYIMAVSLILSVLMQSVFLIVGRWQYTVLLGNALGYVAAVLNFFLMGLSVQAATKKEQKEAKTAMKASFALRMVLLFGLAVLGVVLPCFDTVSVLVSLFFPRVAVFCRGFIKKP